MQIAKKNKELLLEKAHDAIVLNRSDKVLRQVSKEKIAIGLYTKLESFYITKPLVNSLYLKQVLYSHKMNSEKAINE